MRHVIKNAIYWVFNRRLIRKGAPGGIYITYDDGPHPENTREILKVLAQYNTKATFFMVGRSMEEYPEIVHDVKASGHTIGFHSNQHDSLKDISFREIREDLAHAKALSLQFDCPISLYRPPFGDLSVISFLLILLSGLKIVMWSLDCRDSFDSLEQIQNNVSPEKISDGEIILFHDDYCNAARLIEEVLKRLEGAGFNCRRL